ncbi:MAG: EAL domain-containing protein [Gammaproteobacteria bacterium]|nr:EAL domain-containing protein [Gammaproteobacteria bacterium]NNL07544.1 EAL domain-containing protein [Gammaproteobacteria bacterium]
MPDINTKQRILLVEESATLRYILGKILQKQNFELLSVDSFVSAINTLQNATLNLDGIIVGWPNYEHFEESTQLLVLLDREPYSDIPVILLSNDAEVELLNWMSTRKHTALVPWENYQEVTTSLHTLLTPGSDQVEEWRQSFRSDKQTRVLFVDDSKSIRTYYKRLLERNGYQVETAESVKQAYDIAISKPLDIAIVDYFMPDENGYVLCQKLRDDERTENIRTAVITGTYLDSVIRDCLQAGAVECMFKNEAEELFLARLSAMRRFIEVQNSIEQQRERLQAILESVGEGVYGVDNDGKITFVNHATLKVVGVEEDESLLGISAFNALHYTDENGHVDDHLRDAYGKESKLRCWETKFKHHSGKPIPVECTVHPLRLNGRQDGSVIAFRDISNQKMLEEKLRWQATHDHLTELYNRRYFESVLEQEIRDSQRTGIMSAMVYIDLDRFKYVNDTAGHETGDRMLLEISRVLSKVLRRSDVIARIGGDEFAILLKNVDPTLAVSLANEYRSALNNISVTAGQQAYHVHASFGVAMMDDEDMTAGDLMANADIACHIAKRMGRNQSHLYDQGNDERNAMGTELGWSSRIRNALENGDFELHYQPILSMADINLNNLPAQDGAIWQSHLNDNGGAFHYEVLVRMRGENGELFYPGAFMPTAERFNLMLDLDMWVIENALKEVAVSGNPKGKVALSINLSGHSLDDDEAQSNIIHLLQKYNVPPSSIVFEITETSAIANIEQANGFIRELCAIGCRFSLDDFGSGFCSFAQLKNLPTNLVKIDGQFVKSMARGATDRAIVTAMNDVAHSLGRYTVAEYVESPEVIRLLKICGVDKVQGNYISPPLNELPVINIVNLQKHASAE